MAGVNPRTVCPTLPPPKEQCTFRFQLPLLKHRIILRSQCVITVMPREEQSHHHSGAPSALIPSACSCCSPSTHWLPSQQKGQSLSAPLWVAQMQSGTHTAMVPHHHTGGCSAERINQRMAHGSCSLCHTQHHTGQWSQPAHTHRDTTLPSAGTQTHKSHSMSSLLQDNNRRQSLSQAL